MIRTTGFAIWMLCSAIAPAFGQPSPPSPNVQQPTITVKPGFGSQRIDLPSVPPPPAKQANREIGGSVCWMSTSPRKIHGVPNQCGKDQDLVGALCYAKCKPGYKEVATVCWRECPAGWNDIGAACSKPGSYTREPYPNERECLAKHRDRGCQKIGALHYANPKPGYSCVADSCAVSCPSGFRDDGLTCAKDSYERSSPPSCDGSSEEQAGLCYDKCAGGSHGVGVVCWAACPASYPVQCGASCAKTKLDCERAVADQVISTINVLVTIATSLETGGVFQDGAVAKAVTELFLTRSGIARIGAKTAKTTVSLSNRSGIGAFVNFIVRSPIGAILFNSVSHDTAASVLDDAWTKANGSANPKQQKNLSELFRADRGDFDWTMLDPTGVSAMVMAFKKPICH